MIDIPKEEKEESLERDRGRRVMIARGLKKAFGGHVVLDGVDFELNEGEVVLLQGDNATGKTTLLNMATGNITPDSGTMELQTNGSHERFSFPRRFWAALNPMDHFAPERVAREGVGRSWQDIRLFPSISLIDNIVAATPKHPGESPGNVLLRPLKVRKAERAAAKSAGNRLAELGLSGREDSSGDKVSLGQSKRVAIARAVQAGAKILFLDEPLAGLDAEGVADVLALLKRLVREQYITIVIVEHVWNVAHVLPLVDTIWDLKGGQLDSSPNSSESMESRSLMSTGGVTAKIFARFELQGSVELPRGARLDIYRCDEASDMEPLLRVQDLVVFRGSRLVIGQTEDGEDEQGLSFTLQRGDLAILNAPNGWGKTTLLDSLSGLLPSEAGSVEMCAKVATSLPAWERRKLGLVYVRSDSRGFPSMTLAECLTLGGRGAGDGASKPQEKCRFGKLSGGEKQRFLLTRLSEEPCSLCLVDEPFSSLDEASVTKAAEMISKPVVEGGAAAIIAIPAPASAAGSSATPNLETSQGSTDNVRCGGNASSAATKGGEKET